MQKDLDAKLARDVNLAPAIGAFGITFMGQMIAVDSGLEVRVTDSKADLEDIVAANET